MELLQIDLTLSGLQDNFGTIRGSKIDSETIDVLLLENIKEQKRNNEKMPKGTRLGKTERDIAFR